MRFVTENALIDTPPGRSAEAPAAVEAADFALIPLWLESDAFDGVAKSAGLARRLGTPAVAVLNFATPNSKSHERPLPLFAGCPLSVRSLSAGESQWFDCARA